MQQPRRNFFPPVVFRCGSPFSVIVVSRVAWIVSGVVPLDCFSNCFVRTTGVVGKIAQYLGDIFCFCMF